MHCPRHRVERIGSELRCEFVLRRFEDQYIFMSEFSYIFSISCSLSWKVRVYHKNSYQDTQTNSHRCLEEMQGVEQNVDPHSPCKILDVKQMSASRFKFKLKLDSPKFLPSQTTRGNGRF